MFLISCKAYPNAACREARSNPWYNRSEASKTCKYCIGERHKKCVPFIANTKKYCKSYLDEDSTCEKITSDIFIKTRLNDSPYLETATSKISYDWSTTTESNEICKLLCETKSIIIKRDWRMLYSPPFKELLFYRSKNCKDTATS